MQRMFLLVVSFAFVCLAFVLAPAAAASPAALLGEEALAAPPSLAIQPVPALRERFTSVHPEGLRQAADVGGAVLFNFFPDVAVLVRFDRIERRADGFSWFGTVDGDPLGKALVVVSPRGVTGELWMPGGKVYQIRAAGGGIHAVREIEASAFPPEKCNAPNPVNGADAFAPSSDAPAPAPSSAADPTAPAATCGPALIHDVLVVWTQQAEDGDANIADTIQAAIDDANASYQNSGINQRLRLVHSEKIAYTESGDIETDRNRLRDTSDGYMDGVHALRDKYGADLVSLIVSAGGKFCGIAFIQESVGSAFASSAFNVVVDSCAVGNHSFGHELGHNMGARHDRYVDGTDGSPYNYNHGYIYKPAKWRTVMAYNDACEADDDVKSCTRLQYWSNPDLSYNSVAMGIAEGDSNAADNRKTLNNTASTVEAFRGRKMPVAESGSDLSRECNDPNGLQVTNIALDGTGSCDPNGDTLNYQWTGSFAGSPASGATPTIGFRLGTTAVTLVVNDGVIDSLADAMKVTVKDTTNPTGHITSPVDGNCKGSAVTVQDNFTDTCDGTLARQYSSGNGTYTADGNYTVTVTAYDDSLNSASDTVHFTIDTTPPTVTVYPAPPPPVKVDKTGTYPLANGFTSGDADTANGGVVREQILIDGCVVLDGNTYGDKDGLLSDESVSYNKPLLCAAWKACGKSVFNNPKVGVRVTDCGGNTATGTITAQGNWTVSPPMCP